MGLNAYEARSYLVLVGHPRFKALELAARAHVPRQKIYEVLDSLVEKGFAQVIQERPNCSRPFRRTRRSQLIWRAARRRSKPSSPNRIKAATGMVDDLMSAYAEGQGGRGTLDYLRIVNDPGQTAVAVPQHAGRGARPSIWNFRGRPTPSIRWMPSR